MNIAKFKILLFALGTSLLMVQCADDDDNGNVIEQITCSDGLQNGDEEGIDCGGSACAPCIIGLDFSGTYTQEDIMGRPAINTFFGGSDSVKNNFNTTTVSGRANYPDIDFQGSFEASLENIFDVYAEALNMDPADLNYETNILNLDAFQYSNLMANFDALQVAPDGATTYYDGTNVLTGRNLSDDTIDFTLILWFGGTTGTRFDGTNGTPQMTFDGVDSGDRDFTLPFPYMETPNQ